MIQMLRWLLFTPALFLHFPFFLFSLALLSLLSTKVCLIHKGLIAITAAAPSTVCLGFCAGTPSLFTYSPERREAVVMVFYPQAPLFFALFCVFFLFFPLQSFIHLPFFPPNLQMLFTVLHKKSLPHPGLLTPYLEFKGLIHLNYIEAHCLNSFSQSFV